MCVLRGEGESAQMRTEPAAKPDPELCTLVAQADRQGLEDTRFRSVRKVRIDKYAAPLTPHALIDGFTNPKTLKDSGERRSAHGGGCATCCAGERDSDLEN